MSVARQAAHGVAWNMLFGVGSRAVQLVGQLFLTRWILPHDYGATMAAWVAVLTAGCLTSFAFGQQLIAKKAPPEIAFQAAVVHIAIGAVAMITVCLIRDPLSDAFDEPEMGQYVLGYAVAHMFERLRYVPERLLVRALRFRTVATINGLGAIAYTGSALLTAKVWSWGGYAMVFAALVRGALTFVLCIRAAPRQEWLVRARVRAADVRDLFAYGLPIMIAIVSDLAATRWDNLIVLNLFNAEVMGNYTLAYSLAEMPVLNIADQIAEVLMPSFSRMEDEQRLRAVVRAAALMGLVVSPLGVGLGAVASTVVDAFIDRRWTLMGPMLAILSIMTVFRPMTWSATAYAQAVQKTRIVMYASFLRAGFVLSLVAIFGAVTRDPNWVCIGAGLGYAIHAVVVITLAGRQTGFPVGAYLVGVLRPLLACVPMFLAVLGIKNVLEAASVPAAASLAVQVTVGVIVYVISAFVLVRSSVNELLRLGREALRRRR